MVAGEYTLLNDKALLTRDNHRGGQDKYEHESLSPSNESHHATKS